jgi:hypothetical protein
MYYYNMGIYDSGSIFGIKMYNFNDDDFANILFEKIYTEIMSDEEKKETYLFYSDLNNKNEIRFEYYSIEDAVLSDFEYKIAHELDAYIHPLGLY